MLPRRIDTPWAISQDDNVIDGEWLFTQNEKTWRHEGEKKVSSFYLEHTPVVPGTTTGTIYLSDRETYVFVIGPTGEFVPSNISNPPRWNESNPPKCVRGILNAVVGELVLIWETPPGPHHVVISYEHMLEVWDAKNNAAC